jgi:hypothetical protein
MDNEVPIQLPDQPIAEPNLNLDHEIELGEMVIEAFQRSNGIRGIVVWIDPMNAETISDDGENAGMGMELPNLDVTEDVDYEKTMVEMFENGHTPLYQGCSISHLVVMLPLFNLCTTHGVSNTFIDQFFSLLKVDLL